MKQAEVVKLCDDVIRGLAKSEGNLIDIFNLANTVKSQALKGIMPDDTVIGRLYGYSFLANGFPDGTHVDLRDANGSEARLHESGKDQGDNRNL